jgi:pimeloyl-ACP methyl ester carboxylesterase
MEVGAVASFVLIPGAGGSGFYWHRVVAELDRRGHASVAVDLPAADDRAGLTEYTDVVVAAAERFAGPGGDRPVLVAQSMGGLTAPLVCTRVPVALLVLVNAMVPRPGESGGQWWEATGHEAARIARAEVDGRPTTFDPVADFFHDVPPEVTAAVLERGDPGQSGTPFAQPWPLAGWPEVGTRFLQAAQDRFFPLEFQRRVVRERLGIEPDTMPGGHLVALSRPSELVDHLLGYL